MKIFFSIFLAVMIAVVFSACNNNSETLTAPTTSGSWTLTNIPGFESGFTTSGSNIFVATQGEGVFVSANGGSTWASVSQNLPSTDLRALAAENTYLFAGGVQGMYVSSDQGAHWSAADSGISTGPNESPTPPTISAICVRGMSIFAGSFGSGIFLSTNNGITWTPADSGLGAHAIVYCIALVDSQLLAATNLGVYRSTNNGITWTLSNSGMESTLAGSIIVSRGTTLAATTTGGVFASTNDGLTWGPRNNGLEGIPYNTVTCIAASDTTIFAGTISGLYVSTNAGNYWSDFTSGLPATNMLAVVVYGGSVWVEVYDSSMNVISVWSRPL